MQIPHWPDLERSMTNILMDKTPVNSHVNATGNGGLEPVVRLSRRAAIQAGLAAGGALLGPLPSFSAPRSRDYFPPPDSQGGWRTLKDAAAIRKLAGLDLPKLDQAFDFTQRCSQNGGLLVVRHGYLVFEKYFGRAHRNATR